MASVTTATTDTSASDIATVIRQARAKKGLSQQGLARLLGISGPAIAQWETGKHKPALALLPQLAEVLECPLEALRPDLLAALPIVNESSTEDSKPKPAAKPATKTRTSTRTSRSSAKENAKETSKETVKETSKESAKAPATTQQTSIKKDPAQPPAKLPQASKQRSAPPANNAPAANASAAKALVEKSVAEKPVVEKPVVEKPSATKPPVSNSPQAAAPSAEPVKIKASKEVTPPARNFSLAEEEVMRPEVTAPRQAIPEAHLLSPAVIRKARQKRDWSKRELATLLHTQAEVVDDWEQGRAVPTGWPALRLAQLLSLRGANLFSDVTLNTKEADTTTQSARIPLLPVFDRTLPSMDPVGYVPALDEAATQVIQLESGRWTQALGSDVALTMQVQVCPQTGHPQREGFYLVLSAGQLALRRLSLVEGSLQWFTPASFYGPSQLEASDSYRVVYRVLKWIVL